MTAIEYVREQFPHRNEIGRFGRIILWNAIGQARRDRIRSVRRYPYDRRFTVPV